MLNLRPFQIFLLAVFGVLIIVGVISFMRFTGFGGANNPYGPSVVIWGTFEESVIDNEIVRITDSDEHFQVVEYVQKDPRTFTEELTNAVAEDRGPDAVFISSENMLRERPKILPVPYETYPRRQFTDAYVDGASIFNLSDGTYGFPIAVDPLVMYVNRDLLSSAGFAAAPRTWEEVLNQSAPRLTRLTQSRRVEQSALAFGEYMNVKNAKEILLMLMLQAGSPLVQVNDDTFLLAFNGANAGASRPAGDASLDFYTQFADPSRSVYSWNRSLPEDTQAFLGEDLALYFGFASEMDELREGNPNLNFDATRVPQGADSTVRRTYGRFYSLAVLRSSDNRDGAYLATVRLGEAPAVKGIAEAHNMVPTYRASVGAGHLDPFMQNAFDSALFARGWHDPNPSASENVFQIMIEDVTSGRKKISDAVQDAQTRINQLFR